MNWKSKRKIVVGMNCPAMNGARKRMNDNGTAKHNKLKLY